ncbi:PREDICTED: rust resistance kinase Lr10 isoform X3 [Theobroma cacao]|uniref:Rust resistance kinase Lr10 isoform X3 n=1 Tax=Theobroma cacao TaxID=3641 RepID=A0AB32VY56_THECC|nr:PREDICTED: rust resistance kinase Lr10 isoform X3 [Theobroma cacao]
MTLQSVIAFHLIICLLYLFHGEAEKSCPDVACREEGPSVRFPFSLKDRQAESCGYPGFELSCSERNETLIEFPCSGQFFVAGIDYERQNIYIGDPQGCMLRRLKNLTVTGSPFTIYRPDYYTLLDCSPRIETSDSGTVLIDCLSSSNHLVYAAPASTVMSLDLLFSCHFIANVTSSSMDGYDQCLLGRTSNFNSFDRIWLPSYGFEERAKKCRLMGRSNFNYFDRSWLYNFTKLRWVIPGCGLDCRERGGECRLKGNNSLQVECFNEYIPPNGIPQYEDGIPQYEEKSLEHIIKGVSIGISIGVLTLTLMVTLIILYLRSRRAEVEENRKKIKKFLEDFRPLNPTRYSFADLQKMTNEFEKKLGQGGYGSVFKGELENGVPVAVKVLDHSKGNGEDFTNEVNTIGRIHHINVVRLLGYCADESDRALVYEFMPNKSLDKFIFPANSRRPKLSWGKLQDIAIGVARGIEYLHQGCDQRILHFDIKPQNILLDIDFNPKISDFGLAKLFPKKESVVSITAVRGTMGYIAPEVYFSGNIGNVSYKTDVYSFGMLLFEMVGGRKNKDLTVENTSQVYFPQWVYNRLADGEDLGIKEEKDGDADIAKKLSVAAIWCVQWDPSDRPSMSTVIQMLEGRTGSLPLPPDPFASLSSEVSDMNVS